MLARGRTRAARIRLPAVADEFRAGHDLAVMTPLLMFARRLPCSSDGDLVKTGLPLYTLRIIGRRGETSGCWRRWTSADAAAATDGFRFPPDGEEPHGIERMTRPNITVTGSTTQYTSTVPGDKSISHRCDARWRTLSLPEERAGRVFRRPSVARPTMFTCAGADAFFLAASIIPGSHLLLRAVGLNPRHGLLGASRGSGSATSRALHGIEVPVELVPDMIEFPVLFVAARQRALRLTVRGELRVRITYRGMMATGLYALGVRIARRRQ